MEERYTKRSMKCSPFTKSQTPSIKGPTAISYSRSRGCSHYFAAVSAPVAADTRYPRSENCVVVSRREGARRRRHGSRPNAPHAGSDGGRVFLSARLSGAAQWRFQELHRKQAEPDCLLPADPTPAARCCSRPGVFDQRVRNRRCLLW